MEILIRDSKSRLFLNHKATWVRDEAQARAFRVPLEALQFCVEHGVKEVELTFRYPDSPPIRDSVGLSTPAIPATGAPCRSPAREDCGSGPGMPTPVSR